MRGKIPLGKPYYGFRELWYLHTVLRSGCWAGTCPTVSEFEQEFANYVGTDYAIATSSCTTALHTAMLCIGIQPGDEVLVPDFTHPATGFAVAYCGGIPKIVDVYSDTYTMNIEELEKKINKQTKAIMPIYAFGMPPGLDEIIDIAVDHDLELVLDAATGLGATYKLRKAGNFGACECFSFYPTKNIATGEGGMITTDMPELAEKAYALVDFGTTKQSKEYKTLGFNYRLSALHAAVGRAQLEKLDRFIKRKRKLVEYYNKRINEHTELAWITPQHEPKYMESAWQRYVCMVANIPRLRDDLIGYLRANDIGCAIGTHCLSQNSFFLNPSYHNENCGAKAKQVYQNTISLPLYYTMTTKQVDAVIDTLIAFSNNYDHLRT